MRTIKKLVSLLLLSQLSLIDSVSADQNQLALNSTVPGMIEGLTGSQTLLLETDSLMLPHKASCMDSINANSKSLLEIKTKEQESSGSSSNDSTDDSESESDDEGDKDVKTDAKAAQKAVVKPAQPVAAPAQPAAAAPKAAEAAKPAPVVISTPAQNVTSLPQTPQETAKVQTLVEGGSDKQSKDTTMIIVSDNNSTAAPAMPVQGLAQTNATAAGSGGAQYTTSYSYSSSYETVVSYSSSSTSSSSVVSQTSTRSASMRAAYKARLAKELAKRRAARLAKLKARRLRYRKARAAKWRAVKLRCAKSKNKRRCYALARRYRYSKICRRGRRGNVCRIMRRCKLGKGRTLKERRRCRRLYRRWRVSRRRVVRGRWRIRRTTRWRTTRRIRRVVRRRRIVRRRIIRRRRVIRRRIVRRRRIIRRRRIVRRRIIRRRRIVRRRIIRRRRIVRRRIIHRKRMLRRKRNRRIKRKFKCRVCGRGRGYRYRRRGGKWRRYRGRRVGRRWRGGGKRVRYRYRNKSGKWVWGWRYSRGGYRSRKWKGRRRRGGKRTKRTRRTRRGGKRRSTRRRVRRYRRRRGWKVKRTSDPHTWWSFRRRINRWRFSRRFSRQQGYWYLRRYKDVRDQCGGKYRNWKCARTHWRKFGIKERRDKLAYRNLNLAESKAYVDRFSDVTWSNKNQSMTSYANQHYREWGIYENRNRMVANQRLTIQQSKCLLNQNVNMVQRFKRSWGRARNYWYRAGWKKNMTYECDNTPTQLNLSKGPVFSAHHFKTFRCNGYATFARLSTSPTSIYKLKRPAADTFKQVSNFNFRTRKFSPKKRIKCHGSVFRKDIGPNFRKQCFCEAIPRKAPIVCAKEGQWCRSCKGNIFYGARKINGTISSLSNMMEKNYRYKENKAGKRQRCTNGNMGGDPNRGIQKHCYCDDVKAVDLAKIKADEAFNRNRERIRREKKRLRALAIQRRRRLRAEAARKKRLERKRALLAKQRAEAAARAKKAWEEADIERRKEQATVDAANKADTLKKDELEAEQEKKELLQKQEATKAENERKAAEAALRDGNEIDRLKNELRLKVAKEKADQWAHRRKMIEQAAALRRLERENARKQSNQMNLERELRRKLVEARRKQVEEARQAAEDAKEEILREAAEEEARRARTEDARQRASVKAAVEKALLEQQDLAKAKTEAEALVKAKEKAIQDEEDRKTALILATKKAAAEELEKRREAKALALQKEADAADDARRAEAKRIRDLARTNRLAKEKALDEERQAELEKTKAEDEAKNAKTASAIRAAKRKARELDDAITAAQLKRQQIRNANKELRRLKEIAQNKAFAAQEAAAKAAWRLQKARSESAKEEARAEQQKKESEAAMKSAEAESARVQAAMEARQKKEAAAFVKARARRERAAAAALAAEKKEAEEALAARKAKDAAMVLKHKKMMADKKAQFEAQFKHVWGVSQTGMSYFTVDIEIKEQGAKNWVSAEDTIMALFKKTLVSDVTNFVDVHRWYKNDIDYGSTNVNAQMKTQMKKRLVGLTDDDRVAELIEEVIDVQNREDLDILIWQLSAAGEEYKKWNTLQTEELDQNQPKFDEVDPFANSTAISSETSSKMTDVAAGRVTTIG